MYSMYIMIIIAAVAAIVIATAGDQRAIYPFSPSFLSLAYFECGFIFIRSHVISRARSPP